MFILAEQRDDDVTASFERYRKYLMSVGDRFPPNAFELATSDWWFNFENHRCPHDAWLEHAAICEPSTGERHESRRTELQVTLLGAYQDVRILISYEGVADLNIDAPNLATGHGDWRYDEFRVSDNGLLIHEIEWAGYDSQSRWIVTAKDIEFRTEPIKST